MWSVCYTETIKPWFHSIYFSNLQGQWKGLKLPPLHKYHCKRKLWLKDTDSLNLANSNVILTQWSALHLCHLWLITSCKSHVISAWARGGNGFYIVPKGRDTFRYISYYSPSPPDDLIDLYGSTKETLLHWFPDYDIWQEEGKQPQQFVI